MTNKPKLLIIYTGGTIGMVNDPKTGQLISFDFNQMYQNQATQGQQQQGMMMMDQGPMAANEAVGGGGFGSLW